MNQCIIYPNDSGGVHIIYPLNNSLSIEEVAKLDVPAGKPYKVVNIRDLPVDKTFRDAWEYQE